MFYNLEFDISELEELLKQAKENKLKYCYTQLQLLSNNNPNVSFTFGKFNNKLSLGGSSESKELRDEIVKNKFDIFKHNINILLNNFKEDLEDFKL